MTTPEQVQSGESGLPLDPPVHTSPPKIDSLVGTMVGKYHIVRKLGEGGMGTVFEALHSAIGQRAAVKVLHPHLSHEPRFVRRFIDEARMISMVGHSGLVKIFDFTKTSDGLQCIIMEFLEGESLWSRCARTKAAGLPVRDVVQIARQVASALAAVHACGIIHRDLKPDNIMLVKDRDTASGERAKILDFGIAKLESSDGEARRTTTGVSLGTPTYMAPEQIEGKLTPTDRIDVYALGIVLFEMLAGAPPFQAATTGGVLRQHLIKEPPPLPTNVPAELQTLIQGALAKEPGERPTMQQIVEQLGVLDDRSKMSSAALPVLRVGPSQTTKRLLGVGGGMLGTLLGLMLVALFLRKAAPQHAEVRPRPIVRPQPAKVEIPLMPVATPVGAAPTSEMENPTPKKNRPKVEGKPHVATKGLMFGDLPKFSKHPK